SRLNTCSGSYSCRCLRASGKGRGAALWTVLSLLISSPLALIVLAVPGDKDGGGMYHTVLSALRRSKLVRMSADTALVRPRPQLILHGILTVLAVARACSASSPPTAQEREGGHNAILMIWFTI